MEGLSCPADGLEYTGPAGRPVLFTTAPLIQQTSHVLQQEETETFNVPVLYVILMFFGLLAGFTGPTGVLWVGLTQSHTVTSSSGQLVKV